MVVTKAVPKRVTHSIHNRPVTFESRESMNALMQFLQSTFGPLVFLFTVSNLAAMGLQVRMPEVIRALRNKKSLALIFVWGWVLGPALGYLITKVLPLAEP